MDWNEMNAKVEGMIGYGLERNLQQQ